MRGSFFDEDGDDNAAAAADDDDDDDDDDDATLIVDASMEKTIFCGFVSSWRRGFRECP